MGGGGGGTNAGGRQIKQRRMIFAFPDVTLNKSKVHQRGSNPRTPIPFACVTSTIYICKCVGVGDDVGIDAPLKEWTGTLLLDSTSLQIERNVRCLVYNFLVFFFGGGSSCGPEALYISAGVWLARWRGVGVRP